MKYLYNNINENWGGSYQIRNTENNRYYIGITVNFQHRWNADRRLLEAGHFPCADLQTDFDIFGHRAFEFSVIKNDKHLHVSALKKNALCYGKTHKFDDEGRFPTRPREMPYVYNKVAPADREMQGKKAPEVEAAKAFLKFLIENNKL